MKDTNNIPSHLLYQINGYIIDIYKTQEENLALYIEHVKPNFRDLDIHKPFGWYKGIYKKSWWDWGEDLPEDGVGCLIVGILMLVMSLSLFVFFTSFIFLYAFTIYAIALGVYFIFEVITQKRLRKKAEPFIQSALESTAVEIELELHKNEQGLDRLTKKIQHLRIALANFEQRITDNTCDSSRNYVGQDIHDWRYATEKKLNKYILHAAGTREDIKVLRSLEAVNILKTELRMCHNDEQFNDPYSTPEHFKERLEEIKKHRSLREEEDYFDILEEPELDLKKSDKQENIIPISKKNEEEDQRRKAL